MIKFTLKGEVPSKKNLYRITKIGGFYQDEKVKNWVNDALWQIKEQKVPKLGKGLAFIYLKFYVKRDKDGDNLQNSIFDLLQTAEIIENDKLFVKWGGEKFFDKENPRVEIETCLLEELKNHSGIW